MQLLNLNTRRKIPAIGFGTWEILPDEATKKAVLTAFETGYRVIDTARIYGNESGVGDAIRESGLPREDLFITTKVWNDNQGFDRTLSACEASLDRLGLDYLDLYLIHWPATSKRHDTWRAFEKLYQDGTIKAAGVANYTTDHLSELLERSQLVPAINQVEFHPFIYEQQASLLEYCEQHQILVEAYSPIKRISRGRGSKLIDKISRRIGKTPQQVVLRWCIQHHTLPLPRSAKPEHIRSNFQVADFRLSEKDMDTMDSISDGARITWDPAGMG